MITTSVTCTEWTVKVTDAPTLDNEYSRAGSKFFPETVTIRSQEGHGISAVVEGPRVTAKGLPSQSVRGHQYFDPQLRREFTDAPDWLVALVFDITGVEVM
jgi:hypothetical protein